VTIYIDTSALLKLVVPEKESAAVDAALENIEKAIVSPLTELEALTQVQALRLSGQATRSELQKFIRGLEALRERAPFVYAPAPAGCFETALRQHRAHPQAHCRPSDRLHISIMEDMGLTIIMTHDRRQAIAAKQLGFEIITPS
jgi:predicted nucleic acid-binding protein